MLGPAFSVNFLDNNSECTTIPGLPGLKRRKALPDPGQTQPTGSGQEMGGFKGGLNQGIWIVSDGDQHLVLKQSRCQRIASGILTEAENFLRILKDHPEILGESNGMTLFLFLRWGKKGKNEIL